MAVLIAVIGFVGLMVGMLAVSTILDGWVAATMWSWFIVPTFHWPTLTVTQAIGLGLVAALLTKQYVPSKDDDKAIYVAPFYMPLMALLMGWVLHTWFWV